jgi:hypothetical protein
MYSRSILPVSLVFLLALSPRSLLSAALDQPAHALRDAASATVSLVFLLGLSPESNSAPDTALTFRTPEDAVQKLEHAASTLNTSELRAIFGPKLDEIANPDKVQATNELQAFAASLEETNRFVPAGEKRLTLVVGRDATPFPVPLVEKSGSWFFDTESGAEELINRRIGRNEIEVLDAVRTYIDAQREYASSDRDGDQVLEYSQKFASSPGMKDGLFWPPDLDGTISPLGPLVAEAQIMGYRKTSDEPQPFHGYYFRILTRQGKHAPGGAYDYVINGNMIGGFALVAWPAEYGETGIMTFIVNQQGRVFQKDLGKKTTKLAESMKAYDPDSSWTVSPD